MTIAAGIDVAQDHRFKSLTNIEKATGCNSYNCHSNRVDFWREKPTAPCNNKNHFSWFSTPTRITVACFWPLVFPVALGAAVVLEVKLFFTKLFIPSYQHLYRGIQWGYNEVVDPKHNIREKEIEA